jgi:hypothetical protein
MSTNKTLWVLLFITVSTMVIADAMASGVGILAMVQADNVLAKLVIFAGGFAITGLVTFTKLILAKDSPFSLKCLWLVAVLIDAYTTIVTVIYYVILARPLTEQVDLTIVRYDPENLPKTLLVFGLTALVTGGSIVGLWVLEKLLDEP